MNRSPILFGGKRNMKYQIGLKLIARLFYKLLSTVSNIEIDVLHPTFSSWRTLRIGREVNTA
jgi:hypothetical protein